MTEKQRLIDELTKNLDFQPRDEWAIRLFAFDLRKCETDDDIESAFNLFLVGLPDTLCKDTASQVYTDWQAHIQAQVTPPPLHDAAQSLTGIPAPLSWDELEENPVVDAPLDSL